MSELNVDRGGEFKMRIEFSEMEERSPGKTASIYRIVRAFHRSTPFQFTDIQSHLECFCFVMRCPAAAHNYTIFNSRHSNIFHISISNSVLLTEDTLYPKNIVTHLSDHISTDKCFVELLCD